MKYLILCLFLLVAPLSAVEVVKKSLIEKERAAQECVAQFSQAYPDVLMTSQQFLTELVKVYGKGEGLTEHDLVRLFEAVEFAAQKHQFQTRKNPGKTPYIIHPIGVAHHLLTTGHVREADILIAALLHDTVEDTDTSFVEIRALFGEKVEGYVRELTDDKSLAKEERKALQIVHAPEKSAGAAQIKLADKWYNLHDMNNCAPEGWDQKRVDAYFAWAQQVVESLPWVNATLKKAVDDIIAEHALSLS